MLVFTCNLHAEGFSSIIYVSTLSVLSVFVVVLLTLKIKEMTQKATRFQSLFNASESVIMLVEMQTGRILESNKSLSKLINVSNKRIKNQVWFERFVPAEASLKARHIVKKQFKNNVFEPFEMPIITRENQTKLMRFQVTLFPSQKNIYLLNGTDISQKIKLTQENKELNKELTSLKVKLAEQESHFYSTFEMSINGIAILNDAGEIIYSNEKLQQMLDYNDEHLKQRGLQLLFDDEESLHSLLVSSKTQNSIEKMHFVTHTRAGHPIDIEFSMSYLQKAQEYFIIIQDITNSVAQTTQLINEMASFEKKAQLDALTKTYNRAYLDETLFHLHTANESYGFILFDIDHFKKVNDTYGHLVGDDVLITLASIIKDKLRSNDILARYGGEEFAIVLKNTSKEDSKMLSEKIRMIIFKTEFEEIGTLTCSFGVTSSEKDEIPRDIIARADEALYLAKEGGRNRVIAF